MNCSGPDEYYTEKPETSLDLIERSIFGKYREVPELPSQSPILYEQSQVLLQELIRELFALLKYKRVDMVIFGGNQVYSTENFDLLQDIVYELHKYSIPYYFMLGPNELRGPNQRDKLIKYTYYSLDFDDTSIIVLDNVSQEIVPEYLPEEANQQYIWLKKTLTRLSEKKSDVYIFSYRPLNQRVLDLIDSYPGLELKLLASSSEKYKYSLTKPEQGNLNSKPSSKAWYLKNSSISVYPLSYTLIEKDSNGSLLINNKEINLEGIRKIAKSKSSL